MILPDFPSRPRLIDARRAPGALRRAMAILACLLIAMPPLSTPSRSQDTSQHLVEASEVEAHTSGSGVFCPLPGDHETKGPK